MAHTYTRTNLPYYVHKNATSGVAVENHKDWICWDNLVAIHEVPIQNYFAHRIVKRGKFCWVKLAYEYESFFDDRLALVLEMRRGRRIDGKGAASPPTFIHVVMCVRKSTLAPVSNEMHVGREDLHSEWVLSNHRAIIDVLSIHDVLEGRFRNNVTLPSPHFFFECLDFEMRPHQLWRFLYVPYPHGLSFWYKVQKAISDAENDDIVAIRRYIIKLEEDQVRLRLAMDQARKELERVAGRIRIEQQTCIKFEDVEDGDNKEEQQPELSAIKQEDTD